MYFANMYCYGSDNNTVGITGMLGCMGVVYISAGSMYAIHIPDNNDTLNKLGGKTFVKWVKHQEQRITQDSGHLIAFINGKNRPDAENEVRAIKEGLKSPTTTLYRILKHLGAGSGGAMADAAAIMVDRVHISKLAPKGCLCYYKRDGDIKWVAGGVHESGQYKINSSYTGDGVPSDVRAGWRYLNADNSLSTTL